MFNERVPNSFVDEVNSKIISMYQDNSFGYINNGNISNIHLSDDGLDLLESCICILANNFICRLNNFLRTHLHQRTILTNSIVNHENSVLIQNSILGKIRLKYSNNPLIGYLNIDSLRDKITVFVKLLENFH